MILLGDDFKVSFLADSVHSNSFAVEVQAQLPLLNSLHARKVLVLVALDDVDLLAEDAHLDQTLAPWKQQQVAVAQRNHAPVVQQRRVPDSN